MIPLANANDADGDVNRIIIRANALGDPLNRH
jgi:hypothetical protein